MPSSVCCSPKQRRRRLSHSSGPRSVVGLQPAVLLFQPLDLLHQGLVHGVFFNQTVDLILKKQIHAQWCLLRGTISQPMQQRFSPAGCRTAGPSPLADLRCLCGRCPWRGDANTVMTTHLSQRCLSDYLGVENLKSSRVSWIMFWMKWICREVRGAAPPCPTTSAMFWEREDDTAADRAGPEGANEGRPKPFNCAVLVGNTHTHTHTGLPAAAAPPWPGES